MVTDQLLTKTFV